MFDTFKIWKKAEKKTFPAFVISDSDSKQGTSGFFYVVHGLDA